MQYFANDLATCYDRGGEVDVINAQYTANREDIESRVLFHTLLSIWFLIYAGIKVKRGPVNTRGFRNDLPTA